MDLGDLISPEAIFASMEGTSKKQVLQDLAQKAGKLTGIDGRQIYDTLLQRERLGSTGVGRGIAIPHGRLASLRKITVIFARLQEPIDFDSPDGEPVDLIFLLIAPEHAGADHLKALARISRLLRAPEIIDRLRASNDRNALYEVLTQPAAFHAA
ncbi:MAG TPA: PTS IIA-like nitrogen regulatory protein PtsN [Dongiaceae bacterium]|nr:PTS IIA-like nitrogen regulatory protein PtsN [Dongiaceae bacterium]